MLKIDIRKNRKLKLLMDVVNADRELQTTWKCSNINAIDRLGLTDHGPTHVKIITDYSLKLLRLLKEGGVEPSGSVFHRLDYTDCEVIVVLASLLHDLGISVHRDKHEEFSLFLANKFIDRLLPELYPGKKNVELRTIIKSEVLHAIITHRKDMQSYTIEGGVVKLADALDMEKGRARIPFNMGEVNIHSVSALAIGSVSIEKGKKRPVTVRVKMLNSAGIFQIDELLKKKLEKNPIREFVSVVVETPIEEKKIVTQVELNWD